MSSRLAPQHDRYAIADAEAAGHRLNVVEIQSLSAPAPRHLGDCSCGRWYSSDYGDRDALERAHLEHAASAEGVCWACSQPSARGSRPNVDWCYLRFLMAHSDEGRMPRDVKADWPGWEHAEQVEAQDG